MKIRIKDIAQEAGVSIGTVDRVLHNRGEVAEETRNMIMKIIEKHNYKPNIIAKVLASKKVFRLGILLPITFNENDYWNLPQRGILRALDEIAGFGIHSRHFLFDMYNVKTFEKQAKQLLKYEPDGVVIAPFFQEQSISLCEELNKKEIPYVFIDSALHGQQNIAYIGQDAFQSGYLAGKLLNMLANNSPLFLIANIAGKISNSTHYINRGNGFRAFFSNNDLGRNIELLEVDIEENSDLRIIQEMGKIMFQNAELGGIFVTNSKTHKIAKYLENTGLTNIKLIGYDLIKDNILYLERGIIDFIINQKPEQQGYKSVMALFNHIILNKTVSSEIFTPIDIVTKENLLYYHYFEE